MKRKWLVYLLFFVVLLAGFYFFLFRGTDLWKPKLPVLSYVKSYRLTAQDGRPYTDQDMLGKVSVVEYFFTSCRGICPKMNTNMKAIYETFKQEPDFMIVSNTCDPGTDSVPRLKAYADSMKADPAKWVFLTGRKDSLYQLARNSYLLDDPKNSFQKIEDQFIHTQFFALVDKNGKVRGQIYDGLKADELDKMKKDIRTLLAEKGSARFASNIFSNNPQ
ncbi:protein SCO1/2 [Hydrobacter penzbergensis]|uniref:Protein SCO1/2 n=1 Tax=Hydrobacter penzbergensis TaxID=1235997 RepID=A0A8X8LFZ9_9BACT|nr:SCO family protein [Hydrobacter penzbergensis]SDX56774.1 protein SCO1/2 [Hydrobacter penzbergensis]